MVVKPTFLHSLKKQIGGYEVALSDLTGPQAATFLADNLWLIVSSCFTFLITIGLSMVQSGFTKKTTLVTTMFSTLLTTALSYTIYWVIGYSLMYGGSVLDGWLYFQGLFVDPDPSDAWGCVGNGETGCLVPAVDFFFQASFATVAASIVYGLVAERIKLWAHLFFITIFSGFIYPISGSWQWNGDGGWLSELGFIDFAGSSIVNLVGAWAGLTSALLLGPRTGKYIDGEVTTNVNHNKKMAGTGSLLILLGWMFFNGGSELAMDQYVAYVLCTTILSAVGGIIGSTIMATLMNEKNIDLNYIINGLIGGCVSISAGCGNMTWAGAWLTGFVGGLIVPLSIAMVENSGIDDPVGAFTAHGVCGTWGTLAIGLWGVDGMDPGAAGIGLFNGGGISQLGIQALGAAGYTIWTILTTSLTVNVMKLIGDIRVSQEQEANLDQLLFDQKNFN